MDKRNTRQYRNQKIVNEIKAKGCCLLCGYSFCIRALHFHHIDPSSKARGDRKYMTLLNDSTDKMLKEISGCILVCANCHAEIHAGLHPEYLATHNLDRVVEEDLQRELAFNWESK